MSYLHGEMVLHRDLVSVDRHPAWGQFCWVTEVSRILTVGMPAALQKPSNLFLTSSGSVVLGDFGLATRLRSRQVLGFCTGYKPAAMSRPYGVYSG